jgi:ketosteroid isomerase-like protein
MHRPAVGSVPGGSWMDVQSTIRGLTQDFATAFNTANYDQAAALFASDAYFLPPHREAVQGQKPIELMLREYGEAGYQNLRLETIRVDHSGDMAVKLAATRSPFNKLTVPRLLIEASLCRPGAASEPG